LTDVSCASAEPREVGQLFVSQDLPETLLVSMTEAYWFQICIGDFIDGNPSFAFVRAIDATSA